MGVESIMAYVQSKGHLVELIYEPALGDNGYIDIPWLNNFFYNDELVINKALRFKPDVICFSVITNLYGIRKHILTLIRVRLSRNILRRNFDMDLCFYRHKDF